VNARLAGRLVVLVLLAAAINCRKVKPEPLVLQGAQLQISNDTADAWTGVEVWLNRYFRATISAVPAHSRYSVPLNAFVSGYAQRFDFSHMQITACRLTAKKPDGSIIEINKAFEKGGLADAFGGKP
jgi:hypothetical protein